MPATLFMRPLRGTPRYVWNCILLGTISVQTCIQHDSRGPCLPGTKATGAKRGGLLRTRRFWERSSVAENFNVLLHIWCGVIGGWEGGHQSKLEAESNGIACGSHAGTWPRVVSRGSTEAVKAAVGSQIYNTLLARARGVSNTPAWTPPARDLNHAPHKFETSPRRAPTAEATILTAKSSNPGVPSTRASSVSGPKR